MSFPSDPTPDHVSTFDPAAPGSGNRGRVWSNLSPAELTEHTVRRGEALLTDLGAVAALTGKRTGRSPKDKFTVKEAGGQRP